MTIRAATGRVRAQARHRAELRRSDKNLVAVSDRRVPDAPQEIRLFAKARNESTRLPYFLQHFRSLGVHRFFLVDNGSTDGFVERSSAEPDVHVFQTEEDLQRHPYWFEVLLNRFGRGHWCVAADLDEILILPGETHRSPNGLHRLASELEGAGATALDAVLLDMYPPHGVEATGYIPGDDPLSYCDYFDPTVIEQPWRPLNERTQRRFDATRYSGGCRQRVFAVEPNLTKVPFFLHGADSWLSAGAHHLDGNVLSSARAVMLHFKYLHDFTRRTHDAVDRGVYADAGGLYSAISAALADNESIDLRFDGSRQLADVGILQQLGLLREPIASTVSTAAR